MDRTIRAIKGISIKLIPLIETSQKLEKLVSTYLYDEDVSEIVELVDEKAEAINKEVKALLEELEPLTRLYLALTTPFDPSPYLDLATDEKDDEGEPNYFSIIDDDQDDEDKEELGKELEALYEQYKELTSIGPDPEQGYDRSYEAEKSRIEDQIDSLESEILNENPYSVD